jgi:hypothetical protein
VGKEVKRRKKEGEEGSIVRRKVNIERRKTERKRERQPAALKI